MVSRMKSFSNHEVNTLLLVKIPGENVKKSYFCSNIYIPRPRVCLRLEWTDFLRGECNINRVFPGRLNNHFFRRSVTVVVVVVIRGKVGRAYGTFIDWKTSKALCNSNILCL